VESLSLAMLRILEEEAMKENTCKVIAQVPVEVATFLLNEKRQAIYEIEERQQINLVLVPNPHLQTPHYDIQRVKQDDKKENAPEPISYKLATTPAVENLAETYANSNRPAPVFEEPAVKGVAHNQPPPVKTVAPELHKRPGFLHRLWDSLFGESSGNAPPTTMPPTASMPTKTASKAAVTNQEPSPQRSTPAKNATHRTQNNNRPRRNNPRNNQNHAGNESYEAAEATTAPVDNGKEDKNAPRKTDRTNIRRGRRGGRRKRTDNAGNTITGRDNANPYQAFEHRFNESDELPPHSNLTDKPTSSESNSSPAPAHNPWHDSFKAERSETPPSASLPAPSLPSSPISEPPSNPVTSAPEEKIVDHPVKLN
jgi:ribonuclease E